MIIHHAEASADGGLALAKDTFQESRLRPGHVSDPQPRGEIVVIPVVEASLAVHRSRQIERNGWILVRRYAFGHILRAREEPLAHVHVGPDLQTGGFPRRRKKLVTQAVGDGQVGPDAIGILYVKLVLIGSEVALYGGPLREQSAFPIVVV